MKDVIDHVGMWISTETDSPKLAAFVVVMVLLWAPLLLMLAASKAVDLVRDGARRMPTDYGRHVLAVWWEGTGRSYVAGVLHGSAVTLALSVTCSGCMRELAPLEAHDGTEEGTDDELGGSGTSAATATSTTSTSAQDGSGDAGSTTAPDDDTAGEATSMASTGQRETDDAGSGESGSSGPASASEGSEAGSSTGEPDLPGLWGVCYDIANDNAFVCEGESLCLHDGGYELSVGTLCVPTCETAAPCDTPWGDGVCWDTDPGVDTSGYCIVPCTMDGCPAELQCIAFGPQQVLVCVEAMG